MGYFEVITGQQTWRDYVSSQQQVKSFEKALQKPAKQLEKVIKVGIANEREYQAALEAGLGAVRGEISYGMNNLANSVDLGVDKLSRGIDQLNADFNLVMGDVVWKLEAQSETLASILKTLQAPLDTQAKELRYRAEDAYQNGWHEEALDDFLESARKNYQDFSVHRSIANIYLYHLIDLSKSLDCFRNASKYALPRDSRQAAEAEYFAGVVCSLQKDTKQALAHLREATELNPLFFDAFYLHASFAGLLGDADTATRSLETAIKGDARYHERAKTSPVFEKVQPQIQSLLDRLMEQIRKEADEVRQSIEELRPQCDLLLPQDRESMLQLFSSGADRLEKAKTYNDYLLYQSLLPQIENELRRYKDQKRLHNANVKHTYDEQLETVWRSFLAAAGGVVVGYLIVSMGGCIVRSEYELGLPFNSYVREGIAAASIIAVGGIFSVIRLWRKARQYFATEYHP
jgi:tetratricopeptide (TPR) repeat protein